MIMDNNNNHIKVLIIVCLIALSSFACRTNSPMPPNLSNIKSLSESESGCQFIRSLYIEARDQTLNYYVVANTEKFGGNRYKIINVSHELVFGVDIAKINFEIYWCGE